VTVITTDVMTAVPKLLTAGIHVCHYIADFDQHQQALLVRVADTMLTRSVTVITTDVMTAVPKLLTVACVPLLDTALRLASAAMGTKKQAKPCQRPMKHHRIHAR
jgi:hypothetical protein